MTHKRDSLFARPLQDIVDFNFNTEVAQVFADMVKRSVPGYGTVIALTGVIARHYAQAGSLLYDLGCSLGASSLVMQHHLEQTDCQIIAVDNSEAMLDKLRLNIRHADNILPVCADIRDIEIKNASVVVLNYTLQFLPVNQRRELIEKIYHGLLPGGVLVLSEKVLFDNSNKQELFVNLHHDFKKANGYSDLEVSQKRSALENTLITESVSTHRQRLLDAGFSTAETWFQCLNFCSFLAEKADA